MEPRFGELVLKHFHYLVDDYDFQVTKTLYGPMAEALVEFRSPTTIIQVAHERSGWVEMFIGPQEKEELTFFWPTVIEFLSPAVYKKVFTSIPDSPGQPSKTLDMQISELAQILRQYCQPILRGDFSRWEKMAEFRDKRLEDFMKKKGLKPSN